MCGRSMYCNTCRLALVIRLCRVTSSLLPWLGSHDLSSATVQRSSGAAAMVFLQEKQFAAQRCCVKFEKRKAVWVGKPQTAFPSPSSLLVGRRGASAAMRENEAADESLSVGHVSNHAKRERCAADEDFVGIHAINILARDDGPLDLVIVAAAADKRDVVHAGKRVRNLRAVEEDGAWSQVGMDANIQELLRELVPVFCNTGATQQSRLIVF